LTLLSLLRWSQTTAKHLNNLMRAADVAALAAAYRQLGGLRGHELLFIVLHQIFVPEALQPRIVWARV
jgi:hypothetical protein